MHSHVSIGIDIRRKQSDKSTSVMGELLYPWCMNHKLKRALCLLMSGWLPLFTLYTMLLNWAIS